MPYVLTCSRALRAYVLTPTCFACLRAHVPTCLACLRAYVPTSLHFFGTTIGIIVDFEYDLFIVNATLWKTKKGLYLWE